MFVPRQLKKLRCQRKQTFVTSTGRMTFYHRFGKVGKAHATLFVFSDDMAHASGGLFWDKVPGPAIFRLHDDRIPEEYRAVIVVVKQSTACDDANALRRFLQSDGLNFGRPVRELWGFAVSVVVGLKRRKKGDPH